MAPVISGSVCEIIGTAFVPSDIVSATIGMAFFITIFVWVAYCQSEAFLFWGHIVLL